MPKVVIRTHDKVGYVWYYCPGCKENHGVPFARWNWNGGLEAPTLSPSVRHFIPAGENRPEKTFCHYFIRNGKIEYCGDCLHKLKGKTVEMQEPIDVPENS